MCPATLSFGLLFYVILTARVNIVARYISWKNLYQAKQTQVVLVAIGLQQLNFS